MITSKRVTQSMPQTAMWDLMKQCPGGVENSKYILVST